MNRLMVASLLSGALALQPALASGALTIGAAAGVRGAPRVQSTGEAVARIVESGKPVFLNDHVTTDPRSKLQVLLKDETVFTLGPNSDMVLDEFVYDPASESRSKVSATITKGVFRFVTGKIANATPSNMKVKLPVGTIGIRGTIVAGIAKAGMCAVMLAGPGAGNNANARSGAFDLSNGRGSTRVSVAGEGSMIQGNSAPTPPGPLPASVVGDINAGLASAPTSGSDEGSGSTTSSGEASSSASEESGDSTASGQQSSNESAGAAGVEQALASTATQGSQENVKVSAGVADGIASWDQVRSVQTPLTAFFFSGHSSVSCPNCFSSSGTVGALQLYVDFANKELGGGSSFTGPSGFLGSFIHLHGVYGAGDTVEQRINPFLYSNTASFTGNATCSLTGLLQPVTCIPTCLGGESFNGTTVDLRNKGGVAAAEAVANLQFNNTAGTRAATGSIVAPR